MRHLLLAAAILAAGSLSACSDRQPSQHASVSHAVRAPAALPRASIDRAVRGALPAIRVGGVAKLPDRGTLVAYPKAAPIHDTAYTWRPVEISETHAIAAIAKGELDLTAPDGSPIRLRYARHVEHADGNWTWIGSPAGATPGNEAIITFGPTAVFGTIPTQSGNTLRLTTIRGRTWMLETDGAMEARMGMTGADPSGRTDARPLPRTAAVRADDADLDIVRNARTRTAAAGASASANANLTAANAAPAANTVDVLVGYTPQFASRFGGTSGAVTRITFLVDVANQAYAASQVDAAVHLAGTLQVDYTETNTNSDALYDLSGVSCTEQTNGSLDCSDKPVPAALQPLKAMRDTVGADAVSLIRNFNSTAQAGCGIAWLLGSGQTTIAPSDEAYAMSVVSDSNGDSGGAFPSGGMVCRDEALAHELGHNMGAQHDRDTAADTDGVLQPEEYGRFPYSFGYRGGAANIYTVMAYGASGQHKVRVFSNPNIQCTWSTSVPAAPCGIADQSDNARTLRQTIPVVAAFRAAVVPVTRHFPHDFDGNRKEDFLWYQPDSRELYTWFMSGGVPVIGQTGGNAFLGTAPGAVNDFGNDGFADVLLVGSPHVYMYTGNGAGGFSAAYVGARTSGFNMLGTADFDADGKADVFWFNPTTGALQVWRMNGAVLVDTINAGNVIGGTQPIAIGDFGGDGRADILLGSPTNVYMLTGSAGGFSAAYVAARPTGWNLLSSDDVNADMKSDLTWYNPGTRELYYWVMNGGTPVVGRGGNFAIGGTEPMRTGDYNGDGRLDIVLGSASNLYMMSGNAAGNFDAAYVAGRPGGWQMQ